MGVEEFLRERGYAPRCGEELMAPGPEVLVAGIGDADVVAVALGIVDGKVMDRSRDLKLIVKCGIGVDCIDVDAARERDIPVIRMGGVNFNGVAEWVIGASIVHLRQFRLLDEVVRTSAWRSARDQWTGLVPGLTGRILGLFGVGSIGSRVAQLATAHGMRVVGFDPYITPEAAQRAGVELVGRDDLFREADVLSIHAVLTEETRHAVGAAELGLMKPTAILVNAARGPIVDEAALVSALAERRIAGAALDVFEVEPPAPDNPLLSMDTCLLSPHLAGCTDAGYREIGELAATLIDSFLKGEPLPRQCVVVEAGALRVEH